MDLKLNAGRFTGSNYVNLYNDNRPEHLKSEDEYHIANHQSKNWQDLYIKYYGMTENEMLKAGTLWTEHQLKNNTPV